MAAGSHAHRVARQIDDRDHRLPFSDEPCHIDIMIDRSSFLALLPLIPVLARPVSSSNLVKSLSDVIVLTALVTKESIILNFHALFVPPVQVLEPPDLGAE